ncbi:TPA: phage major capsid protein, partial [Enterococcus faecium]|nr:phage major capsid protein [Enterococcus faecium]
MDTELLKKMKARREQRLTELREKVESGELREADLEAITKEIDAVVDELNGIKSELSEADRSDEGSDADEGTGGSDGSTGSDENRSGEGDEGDEGEGGDNDDSENRSGMISQQQRDGLLGSIKNGLEARAKMTNKQKDQQLRKAFANFVVGNISEAEARALGIEAGNGSVTVPEVIASEVITYAQEENLLRKYGTVVRTSGDVKYPILVKKADANVNKKERSTDIAETAI